MSICYIFILGGGFLKIRFSQKPKTYNVLFIEKIYFLLPIRKEPRTALRSSFRLFTPIYIMDLSLMGIEPILTYARLGRQVHAQVGNPLHRLNHDSAHLLLLGFQQVDDQFVVHLQNYARKDALLVEAA